MDVDKLQLYNVVLRKATNKKQAMISIKKVTGMSSLEIYQLFKEKDSIILYDVESLHIQQLIKMIKGCDWAALPSRKVSMNVKFYSFT